MTENTAYLLILTLNINVLSSPIKRYRMAGWVKKKDLTICCLHVTHLTDKDKYQFMVKGWKKIFKANGL
jgi:hypothetical protein